jgi:ABC-type lipoprotein export system ATPase subunit
MTSMLLSIEQVSKTYHTAGPDVRALDAVSVSVEAGSFTAVQGPSGCGKSTLLLIAGGLLAPDSGSVQIDGSNPYVLTADGRAKFRATNVGFVFQQFHLIPYLDVLDNVLAPAVAADVPQARERAEELIHKFGMEHRLYHTPGQLSTGERQRTALARALLHGPKLLLADEPTGNLDRENAEAVLGYLKEFTGHGGAVLLVTHDDHAVSYADEVVRLRDGRLVTSEQAEPATPV